MKSISLTLLTLCVFFTGLNAFADVEEFVGVYLATDGDGSAEITSELVKEATLFEPAVFSYSISISRQKDDLTRSFELEENDEGGLSGYYRDDCDNPDCYALDSLEVTVSKVNDVKQIAIIYKGYITEDGSDDSTEFEGEAQFVSK